jgi:hypothetical protein
VRFSTKGVKKIPKNVLGKIHVKNKKLRKNFFPVIFSLRFFCRVFGRFSARGAQKHPKQIVKNQTKKSQKKVCR